MDVQPYRISAPRPDTYGEAWAHLRTRRLVRRIGIGLFVYGVVTALIFAVKDASFPPSHRHYYYPVFDFWFWVEITVAFLAVTLAISRYLVPFVCPRCGQPFFHGLFMEIGFTKHCVSCGLAEGAPTPLSEERVDDDERSDSPLVLLHERNDIEPDQRKKLSR